MRYLSIVLCLFLGLVACREETAPATAENRPEEAISDMEPSTIAPAWAADANIYEVNIRQYTEEGTFAAFAEQLPRLQEMGVEILWLMPIHPISKTKRKGTMGSYYAVSDYLDVNPEFGTRADFRAMVDKAHELDMRVIIDWVPNHTGWDHVWIERHPDYYTQDADGKIIDPINPETGESWGWTDVADLNYDNDELRDSMIQALLYWPREFGIDGYRVDVAHGVPVEFWDTVADSLFAAYPDLFMLAEAEVPDLRNNEAFIMDYGWSFHHLLNHLATGEEPASAVTEWYAKNRNDYDRGYHMHFIDNHDENSWAGTVNERMGANADAMAIIAFTIDGMPLIYSGQEAGLDKRLEFFEKDPIEWGDYAKADFYKTLLQLKKNNVALHNGTAGAPPTFIESATGERTLGYYRKKGNNTVLVLVNTGDTAAEVTLKEVPAGTYQDAFGRATAEVAEGMTVSLPAHGYKVWVK